LTRFVHRATEPVCSVTTPGKIGFSGKGSEVKYEVQVVDGLAAEWVLMRRAGECLLFIRPEFDTPATHARVRRLVAVHAA